MTPKDIRKRLQELASKAELREQTNASYEGRQRAKGTSKAYRKAAELVSVLVR